jgi:hypothetical protein
MDPLAFIKHLLGQDPAPVDEPIDTLRPLDENRADNLKWFGTQTEPITDPYVPMDQQIGDFVNKNVVEPVSQGVPGVYDLLLGNTLNSLNPANQPPYDETQALFDAIGSAIDQATPGAVDPGAPMARALGHNLSGIKDAGFLPAIGALFRSKDARAVMGTGDVDTHTILDLMMMKNGETPTSSASNNAHSILDNVLKTLKELGVYAQDRGGTKFSRNIPYDPMVDVWQKRMSTPDFMTTTGMYTPNFREGLTAEKPQAVSSNTPEQLLSLLDSNWNTDVALHEGVHALDDATLTAAGRPNNKLYDSEFYTPGVLNVPSQRLDPDVLFNAAKLQELQRNLKSSPVGREPEIGYLLRYMDKTPAEFLPTWTGPALGDVYSYARGLSPYSTRSKDALIMNFQQAAPYIRELLKKRGVTLY